MRLGWSHGDQEVFSTDELIRVFDLGGIGRSPARFDFAKLENLNGIYMRQAGDEELVEALDAVLPELGPPRGLPPRFDPELRAKFLSAMPGLKERAKTLVELLDGAAYLSAERPLSLDDKARGLLDDGGRERLRGLPERLGALPAWTTTDLEGAVRAHAENLGVKLGQVAQPLRAALTGRTTSPGLFDVMAVLGREETLGRLADQVELPRAA